MKKIAHSVDEMVGKTPLLEMRRLAEKCGVKATLLGKCEAYNPLFSVKDRVAQRMLDEAEKSGQLTDETIFVEATSGNTGIALAALCAARGYKLVITMPENMTKERIMLMRHFGAEVILTPAEDGMKGSIAKADLLAVKNPNVVLLRQFCNAANPDAHRFGTAMEILEQTGGEVDVLVSAVGTSGTLTGAASTLRTSNPDLYSILAKTNSNTVLLNNVTENQTLVKNNLENNISSLKNVDKTEAATKLLLAVENLQASYSVMQTTMSLSILDYLK